LNSPENVSEKICRILALREKDLQAASTRNLHVFVCLRLSEASPLQFQYQMATKLPDRWVYSCPATLGLPGELLLHVALIDCGRQMPNDATNPLLACDV